MTVACSRLSLARSDWELSVSLSFNKELTVLLSSAYQMRLSVRSQGSRQSRLASVYRSEREIDTVKASEGQCQTSSDAFGWSEPHTRASWWILRNQKVKSDSGQYRLVVRRPPRQ